MARANVARRQGDDFQARLFWLKAASLLDPNKPAIKVAFETGPKSFDDILVEYDPNGALRDHDGERVSREHIQCKWHTTAGTFGYEELIDPAFLNASRHSLLERARNAQANGANGVRGRLKLVTNWRLRHDDPMVLLVRKESDALDVDRLFDGTTDRSQMGKVRKLWCEHLGVNEDGLRLIASVLSIAETTESLASLRERLDGRFATVGMKRVPDGDSAFFYDDLAFKLLAQGRVEFNKDSFREMCREEGLLEPLSQSQDVPTIGVRSFMHPIDALEARCDEMLNLVPYFEGRSVREEAAWEGQIYPELRDFMVNSARGTDHLRLVLDAHVSLAVAVGALLNVKSGKRIEIEQRTGGRRFWSMDDEPSDMDWAKLTFDEEVVADGNDVAVAIGLTHDVSSSVRDFVTSELPQTGRIVYCVPEGGPSQQSVRCGRHAWMLAESVVQQIQRLRDNGSASGRLHVFFAGPNAFAFFLGQHQQAFGPASIYEWDFDGLRGGGYSVGLSIGA